MNPKEYLEAIQKLYQRLDNITDTDKRLEIAKLIALERIAIALEMLVGFGNNIIVKGIEDYE